MRQSGQTEVSCRLCISTFDGKIGCSVIYGIRTSDSAIKLLEALQVGFEIF